MALERQKIAMPIVDGLDTKGDDKTILPTRFTELENVVFTSPGSMQKRYGYQALPNTTLDDVKIVTGSALSHFNEELLLYSNSSLYAFSDGEQKWQSKGEIRFCNSSSQQVSATSSILENPSSFTNQNITCYAYERRQYTIQPNSIPFGAQDIYTEYKSVQVVIVDNINNTVLAKHDIDGLYVGLAINSEVTAPKVGYTGNKFVIMFTVPRGIGPVHSSIRTVSIDYLNPKVITLQPDLVIDFFPTTAPADLKYDVVSFNNQVYISYTTATQDCIVAYIDSQITVQNRQSLGISYSLNNISLNQQGTSLRVLITALDGSKLTAYLWNNSLQAQNHPASVCPIISLSPGGLYDSNDGAYTVSGYEDPSDSTKTMLAVQLKHVADRMGVVAMYSVDSNGTYLLLGDLYPGVEIQSKLISFDGFIYFFVVKNIDPRYTASSVSYNGSTSDAAYQSNKPVRTIYLIKASNLTSEISAQFEVSTAVVVNSTYISGLPNLYLQNGLISVPVAVVTTLQPAGANRLLASSVIKKLSADFSQTSNYFDVAQGEALHISGGLLKMYDGYKVTEHGFLDSPEAIKDINPALSTSGGDLLANSSRGVSGSPISGGSNRYLYNIVYKWTDRTGKVHRSAPSLPVELVTPTSTGKYIVTISFIPLYLTSKENVEIELYRTSANGTIFYRVSQVVDASNSSTNSQYITGSYPNDKTTKFISIKDSVTDIELQYAEPLYTTGGILENDAALSSSFVVNYKSRLFTILSDGYTLQYSKVTGIGEPVRFNASFKVALDDRGGKATALAVMDDHLIIFKERAIFAMTGEGPNDLGQQDDYRTPYAITFDAGCTDSNSLVNNPEGVMFKSLKGIYMIKRNFGLQYIGDSVEKYNGEVIVSSTLLGTVNQIRLITNAGRALVYDYYCNRWTTFTNIMGLDSIEFKGDYYYVRPDGLVYKEVKNFYQDNGQFIKMRIKSAWIQIGGVQGFERFYQMLILGTYKSAHNLLVKLSYDFNNAYQQEALLDIKSVINPTTYGSVSPYGAEPVYGGTFPLYQWQIYPKIQKCQSFQFQLEDVRTEIDGASFSLSHIMAEVGIKVGSVKKANSNVFGTK